MTTIEKLKDLRSKFENSYMAVNIMDDLISDEYFNDDSFCKILFNSKAIDGQSILWDMDGMINELWKVELVQVSFSLNKTDDGSILDV